jgi:hypothetical protein
MGLRAYCLLCSLIGGVAWLLWTVLILPHPFQPAYAISLLLLAPLVLVSLGLRLVLPERRPWPWSWRTAFALQLPAVSLLLISFSMPAGTTAAALALPWLACTGLLALCGLDRLRSRGFGPPEELAIDAGLAYIAIGGGWTVLSRYGARPLGFEDIIVLLTAIHFHYAGFALPLLTGLAGRALGGRIARIAAWGVIAGVPLVAIGITGTQLRIAPLFECLASWVLAGSGLLTAWLYLRLAARPDHPRLRRVLWGVAGLSLAFGMVLAAVYGSRSLGGLAWLDVPWMRALHGTADALGFGLAGILGWSLYRPARR